MEACRATIREFRVVQGKSMKERSRTMSRIFNRIVVELWVMKFLFLLILYFMVRRTFAEKSRIEVSSQAALQIDMVPDG